MRSPLFGRTLTPGVLKKLGLRLLPWARIQTPWSPHPCLYYFICIYVACQYTAHDTDVGIPSVCPYMTRLCRVKTIEPLITR